MPLLAHRSPFDDAAARHGAGRFGMILFVVSLGVLFLATAIGIVAVRVQLGVAGRWPEQLPTLPVTVYIGTLVLLVSSLTMHLAVVRARADAGGMRAALLLTFALGALFLLLQVGSWLWWFDRIGDRWDDSGPWRLALTAFYVLTGLHALHVVGGLVAFGLAARAVRRVTDAADRVAIAWASALYWHFLTAVWIVLLGLLAAM